MSLLSLKERIRHIAPVYRLNAVLKGWQTKRQYYQTMAYYRRLPQALRCAELLAARCGDRLQRLRGITRPLRLFFLGTDEHQDRGGTLQSLARFGDVQCFTRGDGTYGQNHPGPTSLRRASNTQRLVELFNEMERADCLPDILIGQTWASFIDPVLFSELRNRYGTLVINIAMDDRHQYWGEKVDGLWGGTHGLIPHIDLALTAAPECVAWYQQEGCPALYFPEASDPAIYRPFPELPKQYEVSFIGGRYGVRERIVMALRAAGIEVAAFGNGWEGGRIATEDAPRVFAQSKIVLGVGTIGHCTDFFALKMRDFDAPMSGSLYLTHDNPDLRQLYAVGREIVTYQSLDDCIEQATYYLQHDQEREQVARAGYLRAINEHTWDRRFSTLFELLRGDI